MLLKSQNVRGLNADARHTLQQALERVCGLALVRSLQGHAFLDFESPVLLPSVQDSGDARATVETAAYVGHKSLLKGVAESGLISAEPTPGDLLVLRGSRLYLRRQWEDELALAEWLNARMNAAVQPPQEWLGSLVERLFPGGSPPEQTHVVLQCAARPLGVIVGGPGTGKTFVVARLLLVQGVEFALKHGRAPAIALLAPTGKAAHRVDASVSGALDALQEPIARVLAEWGSAPPVPGADAALRLAQQSVLAVRGQSSTIHSALQTDPSGADLYRKGTQSPLAADIVVVDEASMVSLGLMRALCDAVSPAAQLVLLGDRGQLQSIEAGSVLADIGGEDDAEERSPCVFRLKSSRRFPQESGLGRLAAAVRSGAVEPDGGLTALHLLENDPQVSAQVSLVEPESGRTTALAVALAVKRLAGLRNPSLSAAERLRTLESFAVLCAHRRGAGGADEINAQIARAWSPLWASTGRAYDGMPVLVLRNSADLGLSNGDLGLICADHAGVLHAHFAGARSVRVEMLPEHTLAYALTVHKSQGSEYRSLALVLPERESPVLTRELVYTALTRWQAGGDHGAEGGVTIISRRTVLEAALQGRVQRASGLRERIRT
jgi:exodeoxyribonuclease V alpha subunit